MSNINVNINVDSLVDAKLVGFSEKHESTDIFQYKFKRVWIPIDNLNTLIRKLKELGFVTHVLNNRMSFTKDDCFGVFSINNSGIEEGKLYHVSSFNTEEIIKSVNEVADNSKKLDIRWITDAEGNYYNLVEIMNQKVTDSLYPYIEGGVEKYIDDFLKSKSSILILRGAPGLGKTGFIRQILSKMDRKAYITYNQQVFNGDDAFADFISSDTTGAFVIEDADTLLKSREDGNEVMAKLLAVGDGIISMGHKKLIFSTNLASTKDIDPALIRKGRCYDILEFVELTLEQANQVCIDFKLEKLVENKKYSLASIFNRGVVKEQRKTGFY